MEEDYSYEYVSSSDYDLEFENPFFKDENQPNLISLLDNDDQHEVNQTHNKSHSPPPQIDPSDNSIAFSTSINQSKQFIHQNLGVSVSKLKSHPINGLVILRLQDFNLIRNDSRCHRELPHLLILPSNLDQFSREHEDFFFSLKHLYKQ